MKRLLTCAVVCFALVSLTGCAGRPRDPKPVPANVGKPETDKSQERESRGRNLATKAAKRGGEAKSVVDDEGGDAWDDAADVKVFDPLQPVNRAIFSFNHGLYTVLIKPVADTYEFIFPKIVRRGVHNAYENVKFPVRFVNHTLQGRFDRAAKETGKFLVNTTAGVGGLMTPSDKIPALSEVPASDTGQTFAKWGIPHGPYLVIPFIGPSSTRDFVGFAGDTALNPVSWVTFIFGGAAWTTAVTTPSGIRSLPSQMDNYDAITKDALDRYLAARTAYIQYRNAAAKR